MKIFNWLKAIWRNEPDASLQKVGAETRPLREFIYLDEVSLRSLLSSQKGEVTDTTSEQSSVNDEAELNSSIGANTPMFAKAEVASRFQTSNSSTLQTSRKATVQSWFREFHSLANLRILEPQADVTPLRNISELEAINNSSIAIRGDQLIRGELVEFHVRLTADPVFRFGTLMTEFTDMVEESHVLFAEHNALALLSQMDPVNRVLQRLLAGLIPVRAMAIDYVVAEVNGIEYVVHRAALANIEIETHPLEIVGVTEHLAYWKDIRRVLFSEAEFTMLCRVARSGLQVTWTPVKLAEMFLPFAPDLVEELNTASRSSLQNAGAKTVNSNELILGAALHSYKSGLLRILGGELDEDQHQTINDAILMLRARASSATGQRSAFETVCNLISDIAECMVDPEADLKLREQIRSSTGLPLFPSLYQGENVAEISLPKSPTEEARLLDVEIVAIYW